MEQDYTGFESEIEICETELKDLESQKEEKQIQEQRLLDVISSLEHDPEIAELLKSENLEKIQEQQEEIQKKIYEHHDRIGFLLSQIEEAEAENDHSAEVLSELSQMGEDVEAAEQTVNERKAVLNNCKQRIQNMLDKLMSKSKEIVVAASVVSTIYDGLEALEQVEMPEKITLENAPQVVGEILYNVGEPNEEALADEYEKRVEESLLEGEYLFEDKKRKKSQT